MTASSPRNPSALFGDLAHPEGWVPVLSHVYRTTSLIMNGNAALHKNAQAELARIGMSTVTRSVSSRAGAPPSPCALPSFQAGCSRQRESSLVRRRAGLPMLMREVVPRGTFGLAPPGSWGAAAGRGARRQAARGKGLVPAARRGSQVTRWVMTAWIQRSRAAAQAVRACWRASRLCSRVVR